MAIPSTGQRVRGGIAPRRLPVEVDWGLAYEALIGLSMFLGNEEQHSYEVGPAWFKSVRKKASPSLVAAGRELFGNEAYGLVGLAGMAREAGAKSVAALVQKLRKGPAEDVKWALLHADPGTWEAIRSGDQKALSGFLKSLHTKQARDAARRIVDGDAHRIAAQTADLLERWNDEIFAGLGAPLESQLKMSAHAISRLARQLPWDRLIIRATQGVEYRPEPWIDSVVLVPTVLNRPWVDITQSGSTKFFFYPTSPESAAPGDEVVEVYKALGDETRLRILRLLSAGESSLTEIADQLGLAKSTVHGHMRILRSAGLTRSVVGDVGKGYVLNDRPDLNSLLDAYLKG